MQLLLNRRFQFSFEQYQLSHENRQTPLCEQGKKTIMEQAASGKSLFFSCSSQILSSFRLSIPEEKAETEHEWIEEKKRTSIKRISVLCVCMKSSSFFPLTFRTFSLSLCLHPSYTFRSHPLNISPMKCSFFVALCWLFEAPLTAYKSIRKDFKMQLYAFN